MPTIHVPCEDGSEWPDSLAKQAVCVCKTLKPRPHVLNGASHTLERGDINTCLRDRAKGELGGGRRKGTDTNCNT